MFKVILWDVDATLLNFEKAEEAGIRGCFEKFNLGECSDEMLDVYKRINRRYWLMLERGEIEKPVLLVKRFEDFLDAYGLNSSVAAAFNEEYQLLLGDTVVFYDNALEAVQALKGRVLQCAVTNGTKVAQDRKLKNSGLDKELDHIFISEEVGVEKPNKAFFDAVFAKIGDVSPEEVLIVGDSLTSDMKGGNNAGIVCCWYNPAGKMNDKNLRIDYEITDLQDILRLI